LAKVAVRSRRSWTHSTGTPELTIAAIHSPQSVFQQVMVRLAAAEIISAALATVSTVRRPVTGVAVRQ